MEVLAKAKCKKKGYMPYTYAVLHVTLSEGER